jgi:hypothetical protein
VREVKEAERVLREAEDLGVPWREILEAEVRAEKTLCPVFDASLDLPLERLLTLLPETALQSWRVRNRIERLRWEAQPGSGNGVGARRELRALNRYLRGFSQRPPAVFVRESRLLLAYHRVKELLAICRLASKSRRATEDRVERVRTEAKCGLEDARWAVAREDGLSRNHRLEDALSRARAEGHEIPPGRTGPEAFLRLREYLERRGLLGGRGAR